MVDQPRVEVDVRVQPARREVVVFDRDPLELESDVDQLVPAGHLEDVIGHFLDELRAGIVVLVHAVPEAHQSFFAALYVLEESRDGFAASDPLQHPDRGLVCSAVQRTVERRTRSGRRRVWVHTRAADVAHGVGAAVLLVVRVQDEEQVERLLERRVRLVVRLMHAEHHREQIPGVAQLVLGIDVGITERVPVREGGERWHFSEQPVDLELSRSEIIHPAGVGIERRQRGHGAGQHAHGVRVVTEAVEEFLDVLVQERVNGDLVLPRRQRIPGGELSLDQEVRDFEEGATLGELLDRIAAVLEDPPFPIDERDLACTRGGVLEAGVVGEQAEVVVAHADLSQLRRPERAVLDRHFVGPAGAVVGDREGIRHAGWGNLRWRARFQFAGIGSGMAI